MIKSMINFIKKNPLPAAIVLLALTQVPDFIDKHNQNRCVANALNHVQGRFQASNKFSNAVNYCNGGD